MDDEQVKFLADAIVAISQDVDFSKLPESRQEILKSVWVNFVTARTTLEQPDWGTLFNMVMVALPEDDARIFARTVEKFS